MRFPQKKMETAHCPFLIEQKEKTAVSAVFLRMHYGLAAKPDTAGTEKEVPRLEAADKLS